MSQLAIVIPYYKIDFFEETLKSVAAQSNRNFVLYIGSDASPDNPLPIIEKYLDGITYFYFEYQDNLGRQNLALQWERILENVTEEWFQILGDDDLISENFVEEFYKNLASINQMRSSTVRINHIQIDDNGEMTKDLRHQEKIKDSKSLFYRQYTYEISSTLSENIFKTEVYKRKKFKKIPLAWGSDHLAIFDFADGHPISYLTDALVKIRISESSISGSKDNLEEKKKAYQIYRYTIITAYYKNFEHWFILKVFKDYRNTATEMQDFIPKKIALSMLFLGELKIYMSILKKNLVLRTVKRSIRRYIHSQNLYRFNPQRYADIFLGTDKVFSENIHAQKKIFCFWTGTNEMSDNRLQSLEKIRQKTNVELVVITPENLEKFLVKKSPLHPAYENLSLVHKSDYLRGYFMYHHGGGYTDIKSHNHSWTEAFETLNSSDNHIGIGYREERAKDVGYMSDFVNSENISVININHDMQRHYLYLIGNGSYIFKPKSSFWKEWLDEVHARLDDTIQILEKFPGNTMGDNEGYPLPWTSILGQIFHPLCLKYHNELLYNNDLKPLLKNYR